jgi:GAF domain-containing protein
MDYNLLQKQAMSLLDKESDMIANMANFSSLIFQEIPYLNWAGFYIKRGDELVLGPFQGKVACVRIAIGKGVCGTAALKKESVLVDDVHTFDGHIACDSASNSELVVPLLKKGEVFAVFDMDSPLIKRFTEADRIGIEKLADIFIQKTKIENRR